jgi:hypothetical protein
LLLRRRPAACRVITEAAKQSSQGWDSTGDWTEIEVRLRSSGLLNYDSLLLTPS